MAKTGSKRAANEAEDLLQAALVGNGKAERTVKGRRRQLSMPMRHVGKADTLEVPERKYHPAPGQKRGLRTGAQSAATKGTAARSCSQPASSQGTKAKTPRQLPQTAVPSELHLHAQRRSLVRRALRRPRGMRVSRRIAHRLQPTPSQRPNLPPNVPKAPMAASRPLPAGFERHQPLVKEAIGGVNAQHMRHKIVPMSSRKRAHHPVVGEGVVPPGAALRRSGREVVPSRRLADAVKSLGGLADISQSEHASNNKEAVASVPVRRRLPSDNLQTPLRSCWPAEQATSTTRLMPTSAGVTAVTNTGWQAAAAAVRGIPLCTITARSGRKRRLTERAILATEGFHHVSTIIPHKYMETEPHKCEHTSERAAMVQPGLEDAKKSVHLHSTKFAHTKVGGLPPRSDCRRDALGHESETVVRVASACTRLPAPAQLALPVKAAASKCRQAPAHDDAIACLPGERVVVTARLDQQIAPDSFDAERPGSTEAAVEDMAQIIVVDESGGATDGTHLWHAAEVLRREASLSANTLLTGVYRGQRLPCQASMPMLPCQIQSALLSANLPDLVPEGLLQPFEHLPAAHVSSHGKEALCSGARPPCAYGPIDEVEGLYSKRRRMLTSKARQLLEEAREEAAAIPRRQKTGQSHPHRNDISPVHRGFKLTRKTLNVKKQPECLPHSCAATAEQADYEMFRKQRTMPREAVSAIPERQLPFLGWPEGMLPAVGVGPAEEVSPGPKSHCRMSGLSSGYGGIPVPSLLRQSPEWQQPRGRPLWLTSPPQDTDAVLNFDEVGYKPTWGWPAHDGLTCAGGPKFRNLHASCARAHHLSRFELPHNWAYGFPFRTSS